MKRTLLSLAFGLATTVVFGQIEAGTMILGGELNYSSSSTETTVGGTTADDKDKSSNLALIPSFGYMIKDNIGAGLRLGINNSMSETFANNGDINENENNLTVVGLFGRYYMDVAGDALYFHTDLILDFGFGSNTHTHTSTNPITGVTTVNETKTDVNTMLIGIRPGWDYFIGDKWAIELNYGFLGFESKTEGVDSDNEATTTGFGLNLDFTTLGLGARWYF